MAVNTQKFLPSSREGVRSKVTQKVISTKASSGLVSEKSISDIGIIRVKVIEIDSILKGTLALQKKNLDDKKRQESSRRREKQEEKLETRPKAEKIAVKTPKSFKMGLLDWVKNFIGNIVLGYFAVRMIDFLPKMMPIFKFLGQATDFVVNTGGKLLDGLVTFVDWGYKAHDATRGFLKNLGGDNFIKVFDAFNGAIGTLIETAVIASVVVANQGSGGLFDTGFGGATKEAAKKSTGIFGRGIRRAGTRFGLKTIGKVGVKNAVRILRPLAKGIPVIGGLLEFGFALMEGDSVGKAAFKAVGATLFGAIGAALGGPFALFTGGAGAWLGSEAAGRLYDYIFGDKKGQKTKVQGRAEGGKITRGGEKQSGIKRTLSKRKYKRDIPQKPGKVEITSPGSDIGGKEKLFGIFPKPKLPDVINPFNVVKKTGDELGKTDYFGPILAISSKITAGQLPTQRDYQNAGIGINLLIAEGIKQKQLKGGLVAAFAEGGLVDADVLSAAETGGDVSNWVAKTFRGEIESNAQKTLRMIRENAAKKKLQQEVKDAPSPEDMGEGAGVQVSSDSPDFWLLATAAMFENSDPQGAADVAQVIYNRTQYPAWNAPTIRKAILNPNQFQPVRQYGGTNAWAAIKTKEDALRFSKSHGKTQEQLERVAAALLDKTKQNDARSFVGPRDSFRAEAYEKANNHLANETEKTRHGHTFGFEPGGAMIGQFKAGKLSAAMVNAQVSGSVSQKGLPPLPRTNTIGGQNYGDPRENGRRHAGQDYDISGDQKFYSRIGGEVVNIGYEPGGYGNYVDIYNSRLNVTERIAEGSKILVSRGSVVRKGQAVVQGESNTGVIHYEIRRGRNTTFGFEGTIDPKKFLTSSSAFHGRSFGIVPKSGMRLTLHEGEMFKVIDKDSVNLFGYDLTKEIINIENKAQLVTKAPSIIEKLKSISGYTDDEQLYGETKIVYVPVPTPVNMQSNGSSTLLTFGGEESDPFADLYQGT